MSAMSQSVCVVAVADVDEGHVGDTRIASPFYFLPPALSSSPLRMRRLSACTWVAGPPLCTPPMESVLLPPVEKTLILVPFTYVFRLTGVPFYSVGERGASPPRDGLARWGPLSGLPRLLDVS